MKVTRRGSEKNHGTNTVVSEREVQPHWSRGAQTIALQAYRVPHDNPQAHHDYTINLNPKDLAAIVGVLANQALTPMSVELAKALREKAVEIAKLNLFAQGFLPGKEVAADA